VLAPDVWETNLGPFDRSGIPMDRALLPYHTVQEGILVGPDVLEAGQQVEMHVVDTDDGVLSVALVTTPGSIDDFRTEALRLANTLELFPGGDGACLG
jgi:hypothetical protein